jgi:hypothetical protein
MAQSKEDCLAAYHELHCLTLERLIDVLKNGVPIQKSSGKDAEVVEIGRAPAPPAYISAAIRFLKDAGVWTSANGRTELEDLLDGFEDFDV